MGRKTETELLEELNRYLAEQDITVELTVITCPAGKYRR